MGNNNGKIFAPVRVVEDIAYVLGSDSGDVGTLCRANNIAKFAKWHPVPSTEVDLPSVEARRTAGQASFSDTTMQYGVRVKGMGNTVKLNDIHESSFTYVGIGDNGMSRVLDFAHPTLAGYGYRHDAYLDFSASVISWGGGPEGSVRRIARSVILNIVYNPHSTELRKEMLSIRDFMQNNTTPAGYYPCVLFTRGTKHFIHCLYKETDGQTGTVPETLSTGTTPWILDASDLPAEMINAEYTMSIFLASQRMLDGTTATDIANWVTINNSGETQAWSAWFLPVPEVCGFTATIGGAAATKAHVVGINPTSTTTAGFNVSYRFDTTYNDEVVVKITAQLVRNSRRVGSSTKTVTFPSVDADVLKFQLFDYASDYGLTVLSGDTIEVTAQIETTAGGITETTEAMTETFTI